MHVHHLGQFSLSADHGARRPPISGYRLPPPHTRSQHPAPKTLGSRFQWVHSRVHSPYMAAWKIAKSCCMLQLSALTLACKGGGVGQPWLKALGSRYSHSVQALKHSNLTTGMGSQGVCLDAMVLNITNSSARSHSPRGRFLCKNRGPKVASNSCHSQLTERNALAVALLGTVQYLVPPSNRGLRWKEVCSILWEGQDHGQIPGHLGGGPRQGGTSKIYFQAHRSKEATAAWQHT